MARFTSKLLTTLTPAEAILLEYMTDQLATARVKVLRSALRAYAKSRADDINLSAFEGYLQKRLGKLPVGERGAPAAKDLCAFLYDRHPDSKTKTTQRPALQSRNLFR